LHHKAQKVALTQNEQSLISDECVLLRQAELEKASNSTFNERKQMSTKTSIKRVALVAVSALGFGLLSVVPAKAEASTLLYSSTTGTIAATASTATATGTFSVTLLEASATTWTNDATITLQVIDKYSTADTCTIRANDDGSPAGTITQSGVSDSLFASASTLPTLEVASGDLTVTIEGDYTDNGEIEHLVIAGLTVKCSSTAPIGNLYLKVTAGTAEIDGASVTGVGSLNAVINDNDTRVSVRTTAGTFPGAAFYEATNATRAAIGPTGQAQPLTITAYTISPLWLPSGSTYTATYDDAGATCGDYLAAAADEAATNYTQTDQFEVTGHGLRVGDAVVITDNGTASGFTDATTYYAVPNGPLCFGLAETRDNAIAGTIVNGAADGSVTLRASGSSEIGTFTVGDQGSTWGYGTNYRNAVGQQFGVPANTYLAQPLTTATGSATSVTYLGKIGAVGATYEEYTTGTLSATATGSSFASTATNGDINVVAVTSSALNDGLVDYPYLTVTLTNGVFYSAPTTSTGCTVVSTQVYPSASYKCLITANTIEIYGGNFRFDAGVAAGSYLTFTTTVENGTSPTKFTGSVVARPYQKNIAVLGAATISAGSLVDANIGTATGKEIGVITIKESVAGFWRSGHVVGICFPDGAADDATDEDTFYTTAGSFPWATVTSGDVKLAGNVTTLKGTMSDAAAVMDTLASYNEDVTNQCVYWTIYSASTTASTLTINGGAAAAGTGGVVINTKSTAGNGVAAAVGGGTLNNAVVLGTATIFNRTNAALFAVTGTAKAIAAPGSAQAIADVTITEGARGYFAAGAITIDLTDSAGADTTAGSFASTVGANAPLVTQTATSNIVWDYTVTDSNTITINIRAASTDNPATFSITNVKVNTIGVKSNAVGVSSSDFYWEVTGAGVLSQSFLMPAATVSTSATSTADALLELAKAIGTGKSVEEAADAAAEAIDAANAATDAANLAAEAADAATVAAEEARDAADSATAAVEELATQVATLMAALKAQLTTLANTVAKIAKKVKA
jgi:hypothetical protein